MNHIPPTRRTVLQAIAGVCAYETAAALAQTTKPAATAPASQPVMDPEKAKRIRALEEFFARLYAKPLESPERLPKEIAVMSLARIDAPATTAALLGQLKGQPKEPVVAYLAWEALHARQASLTPEQRRDWITGGVRAAGAGGFPGWTAAPLVRALAGESPAGFDSVHAKLAMNVLAENDLADPKGKDALDALRELVAAWHEPSLIRLLVASIAKPGPAERVDYVLRGLPSPPPPNEQDPRKLAGPWNAWVKAANLSRAEAKDLKPYAGRSTVFAAPERITSPSDSRWRKELEIGKCTVTDFDLCWVIDSTGSMNETNQSVAAQTGVLIRVCGLVSRRARCGAVYYRHETDAAYAQKCCEAAAANSAWYRTKAYKLTTDASALAATMAAENIPRPDKQGEGNVHPGCAYHGGLTLAIGGQPWSKEKQARRVIVMIGDSHLTPGSEQACAKLTAEAAKHGYEVHAMVTRKAVTLWGDAVKAGGGQLIEFGGRGARTMAGGADEAVFRSVLAAILRRAIPPDFHDRVDPLLAALVPHAKAAASAEKANPTSKK